MLPPPPPNCSIILFDYYFKVILIFKMKNHAAIHREKMCNKSLTVNKVIKIGKCLTYIHTY